MASRSKATLNNQVISSIKPSEQDILIWDEKQSGLALKVTPAGRYVFLCYYRTPDGVQRKPKLGDWPTMTVATARRMAAEFRLKAAQGNDPSAARQEARQVPTLRQFWDDHYRP